MFNYCDFLAQYMRDNAPAGRLIFGQTDPAREWDGRETVEFSEEEPRRVDFISGGHKTTRILYCYSRAASEIEARDMARGSLLYCKSALERLRAAGEVEFFYFSGIDTTPDARGINSGASFYGSFKIEIQEPKRRGF